MFRKAERKRTKLRIALSGVSNSGKTKSALEIATGIGGRIAMIDTENGRGEFYANEYDYDVMTLQPPYTPDRFVQAIKEAEIAGYDVIIIDSLSHAWVGEGGVLSIVERGNGWFAGGGKIASPKHNALIHAITASKLHVLVTMRCKTEYVVEQNMKGKAAPRKVGTAPVQRDGMEYEFTVFMEMQTPDDITAYVSKDNTNNYNTQYIRPSREMGVKFIEWVNAGKEVTEPEPTKEQDDFLIKEVDKAKTMEALKTIYDGLKLKVSNVSALNKATMKRKQEIELEQDIPQ